MKKFVVFANCQGPPLAKTLLESQAFASKYKWEMTPPVQKICDNDMDDVVAKVQNADLFIYQPVQKSENRPPEANCFDLLNYLKDDAKAYSFPSMYFDGYFPHLQTLNGQIAVLNLVHDYFMIYSCAIGINEHDFYSMIRDVKFYPQKISTRLAAQSIKSLIRREQKQKIDIPVSGYIKKNYKKNKLFNQFNHPKRDLFVFVARKILAAIGLDETSLQANGCSYLDAIMTPVYKSTYNNLNLKFEEDFDSYNAAGNVKIDQLEVIKRFFHYYRSQDVDSLKELVLSRKPFIAQMVETY